MNPNFSLPITRINDGIDFSELMPDPQNAADGQNLGKTDNAIPDSVPSATAPTHTAAAIASSKAFNLNDLTSQHYYNEVINLEGLHDYLVIDSTSTPYAAGNKAKDDGLIAIATTAKADNGRNLKPGQTAFAPKPAQITALYYRLIDQLSDRVSLNELNLANNVYGRVAADRPGNSRLLHHNCSVITYNDYYVPLYDSLYRTCINNEVLTIVKKSYTTRYQSPEDVTIQASAGITDTHRISSLRQARVFIHSLTWSLFSAGMNNLLASSRTLFFNSWQTRVTRELAQPAMTDLDSINSDYAEALDDFNLIKSKVSSLVEQLVISRDSKLASHSRFKGMKNPKGCVAFFEAHQWVSPKAGFVYFESAHLVSTANTLIFSGYLDTLSWQIDGYKQYSQHTYADDWVTPSYLVSMIETVGEVVEYIEEYPDIKNSFDQELMDNHRHYYSPQNLVSLLDAALLSKNSIEQPAKEPVSTP